MTEKRIIAVVCIVAVLTGLILSLGSDKTAKFTQSRCAENILLIDPGHGGMDGGAVSADGLLEKDINLKIAGELEKLASEYGWHVVMTRRTDEWLCGTEEGSIRSRKTADLSARRELIIRHRPALTVSIHLNSFTQDPSVNGVQVFYPDAGGDTAVLQECRQLASVIQNNLTDELNIEKERTAMAREGVFLFREVVSPIVIVECGFLSNPAEAKRLSTPEYQRKTAQGIMDGITEFTGVEKPSDLKITDSLR